MIAVSPLTIGLALGLGALVSFAILWALGYFWKPRLGQQDTEAAVSRSNCFLFENDTLIDLEDERAQIFGPAMDKISAWDDLRQWLGSRFGTLPATLSALEEDATRDFPAAAKEDPATLALTRKRNITRVELMDPTTFGPIDQHNARILEKALRRKETILNHAPCAISISNPDGEILWQNKRFSSCGPDEAKKIVHSAKGSASSQRICIPGQRTGQDRHFTVDRFDLGNDSVVYAADVTQVAQAESMRREFIQTLTKIFANLTTGLAVFDRHRQLALFNPALMDLTNLPASFLSGQPPLMQFFDQLRDQKVLPEPKNYNTWRKQIEDMITTASDGLYLEDWALPNGMTYRVTGRPHPDGAIAFLFEDITDNVSIARRYRSQIALRDAVLDSSDNAQIVFGPGNVVTFCNRPCRHLIGVDPDSTFADMTLRDFLAICDDQFDPGTPWEDLEKAIIARKDLSDIGISAGGQSYVAAVRSLPGNSAMVSFDTIAEPASLSAAQV